MRDLEKEQRQGAKNPRPGPVGSDSGGFGWDVAFLLILGTSLALASAAWLLVGLLQNAQQPAAPHIERPEPPSSKYEAVPVSYLSPSGKGMPRITMK
jgi:hypothetical protein